MRSWNRVFNPFRNIKRMEQLIQKYSTSSSSAVTDKFRKRINIQTALKVSFILVLVERTYWLFIFMAFAELYYM